MVGVDAAEVVAVSAELMLLFCQRPRDGSSFSRPERHRSLFSLNELRDEKKKKNHPGIPETLYAFIFYFLKIKKALIQRLLLFKRKE